MADRSLVSTVEDVVTSLCGDVNFDSDGVEEVAAPCCEEEVAAPCYEDEVAAAEDDDVVEKGGEGLLDIDVGCEEQQEVDEAVNDAADEAIGEAFDEAGDDVFDSDEDDPNYEVELESENDDEELQEAMNMLRESRKKTFLAGTTTKNPESKNKQPSKVLTALPGNSNIPIKIQNL